MTESKLETARRYVRLAEENVARQAKLVSRLAAEGRPSDVARTLLRELEATLAEHRALLRKIEAGEP